MNAQAPEDSDPIELLLTTSSAETEFGALDDAIVSGTMYIVTSDHKKIKEMWFYMDDPERLNAPFAIHTDPTQVLEVDTTQLADGPHVLSVLHFIGGGKKQTQVEGVASFVVQNDSPSEPESPPGDEGSSPGDGEVTPDDGETLPVDGESPPADGESPTEPGGDTDEPVELPEPDPSYDYLQQVHVDPVSGSDANAGTAEAPLATLNAGLKRAIANRKSGLGTRVLLYPGTYRESIDGYYNHSSGQPIVLEAALEGEAIVSGSDVWNDWSCSSSLCSHHWPYEWGDEPNPWPEAGIAPIGARREMVFVDGERLEQKMSAAEVDASPGTFYVNEGSDRIQMHLPTGADIRSATVEVAVRSRLFRAQTLHDLVIDGLVFQHAASPVSKPAVYIVEQDRVTVQDVLVQENNWDGLAFSMGRDLTMRRSRTNHNGASGVGAFKTENLLLEDNESNANNWRGAAGGLTGWSVGQKFMTSRNLTIRRHTSMYNQSRGLWLDWDLQDVVLDEVYSCANRGDGIFIEASPGPILVQDSTFCDNGYSGIQTSATHNLSLEGNTISGNGRRQLYITGDTDVRVTDYITGELRILNNENWFWRDNTIRAFGNQAIVTTTLSSDQWDRLMASSDLDFTAYSAGQEEAFGAPGGQILTFDNWRSRTGQDGNSSFGYDLASAAN